MKREDALAFSREHQKSSPTYQRARTRTRVTLPVIMLIIWAFSTWSSGFEWIRAVIYAGVALLWYFIYPARFDKRVNKYSEQMMDEDSYRKSLGPCELILSEDGLHSKSATGESSFPWTSVDRIELNDRYLFIFLAGSIGYPIPLSDVGAASAKAAYDFASTQLRITRHS